MNLMEALTRRNALKDKGEAILTKAAEEKRELTIDEQTELEIIRLEIVALTQQFQSRATLRNLPVKED